MNDEFSSNEERIERLETQVASLVNLQSGFLKMHSNQGSQIIWVVSVTLALKNEIVGISRYLVQTNPLLDEKMKREFLAKVARVETECEGLEAMIAGIKPPSETPGMP